MFVTVHTLMVIAEMSHVCHYKEPGGGGGVVTPLPYSASFTISLVW